MEVVRNLAPLTPLPAAEEEEGGEEVGFNPEIYIGDEQHKGGLRVKRYEDGSICADTFEVNLAPQAPD
ncbi:hypothetical protein TrRE_jg2543 [Triparma retinervis]|uniref:Uncharacterized protein n=1 Tax=Triparma retinervis TaxID=2557542 RepID=A0A9W7AKD2_9STRA|nr:hypothetical protein TrRE_jg2543 [Triparma retinervis]